MVALYARLLALYPASFRERFGVELVQYIRDEVSHGRRIRWSRTLVDLFGSAMVERRRDRQMRTKLAALAFIVLVVGGGTMLVTEAAASVGGGIFAIAVLAALAAVYAVSSLIGRRRPLGAEHDYAAERFRWWWVPALLLAAFQGIFMVGQLVEDPKKENVFALAIISAFSALVVIGVRLRNRRTGNWLIAIGVLPMLPFIWVVVPPIVALVVIVMALADNVRLAAARPAV